MNYILNYWVGVVCFGKNIQKPRSSRFEENIEEW